jgi:3',5'-cyclic AMP phosphodiesterase CpdA
VTTSPTIAHVSDLHITPQNRTSIRNTRRALDYLAKVGVDHIVITGDIAANAETRDFELARKILASYGLLNGHRLSVVIGNHDVFGGVNNVEDILSFPRRCKSTNYARKIQEFFTYFHEAFAHCHFVSERSLYPFAKVVRGVALIGLNSVAPYSKMKNSLGSNGRVDGHQLKKLKTLLCSSHFKDMKKVLLIHHHFSKHSVNSAGTLQNVWGMIERQTMKLRGKTKLFTLFRKSGVDLVLHGHVHENREYVRRGVRFLNGGGTVMGDDPSMVHINLIRVTAGHPDIKILRIPARTETSATIHSLETLQSHEAA